MAATSGVPIISWISRSNVSSSTSLTYYDSSSYCCSSNLWLACNGLERRSTADMWRNKLVETRRLRAVAEETQAPEGGESEASAVSVPVSPSDMLTMFFRAMDEFAIPTVTKAFKGMEGISDLKVKILEVIANVELTKETTTHATSVASNLVERIQGSGFK